MKTFLHVSIATLFMVLMVACGSGGGNSNKEAQSSSSSSSSSSADISTYSFEETAMALNTRSKDLGSSLKTFIIAYNAMNKLDTKSATGKEMLTQLENMVSTAEPFYEDLRVYQELLKHYDGYLYGSAPHLRQSVDPLLVSDVADLIKSGKSEADAINTLIAKGYADNDIADAINSYKKKHMGKAFKTGMTALVGSGAAAVAGLAATTAGAPVLVVTGIAVGTGIVVGAVWSWCTGSNSAKQRYNDHICAIAAVEGKTITLPNGDMGLAIALPQGGPGSMCMHVEGSAPICIDTTIDAEGNTIVADSGCFDDNIDVAASQECNDATKNDKGVTLQGSDCAKDVFAVTASASVSGNATVTVHTSLPTQGCSISYSLVGTDGYTQSETLTTGSAGQISFNVPGGADGVHDSVSISELASGSTTHIGYTF